MDTKDKDNNGTEPFAIVLQTLTASRHFNPSEYRILVACIGVNHIILANGEPFTHSSASLAITTNVEKRTIQRVIKRLCDLRIFRKYGYRFNKKKKYAVNTFNYDTLKAVLLTSDKMSLVKDNENGAVLNNDGQLATLLATEQTTKSTTRRNIVEGTLVAVQSSDRTATTECSVKEVGIIETPAITDHSVSVATKTATGIFDYKADTTRYSVATKTETATEVLIEPKTISGHLVFRPGKTKPLKLPASIGPAVCARRQNGVVSEINKRYAMHFYKEGTMGTELDDFSFCAYDSSAQLILLTCDDLKYLTQPYIQKLCNHFHQKEWGVLAWVSQLEVFVPLKVAKEGV